MCHREEAHRFGKSEKLFCYVIYTKQEKEGGFVFVFFFLEPSLVSLGRKVS